MSRKNSTALAVGTAISGAAVAAFISLGTAHADDALAPDGFSDLFGASGPQAADDHSLDLQLFEQSAGNAAAFDQSVDTFQASEAHGVADLIHAIDPSAFVLQSDPDIIGTASATGQFLVPDDFLGYLATDLDYFLLNPTGLDPLLLAPVIDTLLGSPPF